MADEDRDAREDTSTFRTMCPGCHGQGIRFLPTATTYGDTVMSHRVCRTCDRKPTGGWLPGFQPPG